MGTCQKRVPPLLVLPPPPPPLLRKAVRGAARGGAVQGRALRGQMGQGRATRRGAGVGGVRWVGPTSSRVTASAPLGRWRRGGQRGNTCSPPPPPLCLPLALVLRKCRCGKKGGRPAPSLGQSRCCTLLTTAGVCCCATGALRAMQGSPEGTGFCCVLTRWVETPVRGWAVHPSAVDGQLQQCCSFAFRSEKHAFDDVCPVRRRSPGGWTVPLPVQESRQWPGIASAISTRSWPQPRRRTHRRRSDVVAWSAKKKK